MEARVIGPKEFGKMLGVGEHTAAAHMRKHPRCINVGLGSRQRLRLPLDAAEEIVNGWFGLSPIEEKPKKEPPKPPKRPRGRKHEGPQYLKYR